MSILKSKWTRYGRVVLAPLKQEKKKLMLAAGLMVISVGLQLPLALVTRYIIDDLLPNKDIRGLNLVILTLLGVMILKGFVDVCQNYTMSLARERIVANIQMRLLDYVQSLSLSFFWKSKAAYLSARISADSTNVANAVTNSLLPAIREVVTVVFAIVMILIFQWKLGLASLAILPMFVVSLRLLSKRRRKCAEAYQESYAVACESLTESLSAMEVVKAFVAEENEAAKVWRAVVARMKAFVQMGLTSSVSTFAAWFIAGLGPLLVLWFGGRMIVNGELTLGTLMAFNIFVGYLFAPAQRLMNVAADAQSSSVALDRLCELFETKREVDDPQEPLELGELRGDVSFRHISFSYSPGQPVLRGINLDVPAGSVVALVGRNGAGKTTLVNLIPRFFDPDHGQMCVDGIDVRSLRQKDLRSLMAMVPQETVLFSGTIRDNIRYGSPEASDIDVREAMTAANADEFINALPDGLDTEVGENGVGLSGGQRQRIAIARAMIRQPRILILDEATSEVDVESEQFIRAALEQLLRDRTTFIIAHRLATVVNADLIVVLDKGEIIDQGTHQELFERCSLYRDLCETQFLRNFEPEPSNSFAGSAAAA
ncbi:MAG TPA: ABC transporter ATP-binding protein [Pyrinomonadaceae bacterium]|nr:ABC transporter ATP-binding protein [Pyrinomonadaceae bacterium]